MLAADTLLEPLPEQSWTNVTVLSILYACSGLGYFCKLYFVSYFMVFLFCSFIIVCPTSVAAYSW